MVKTKRFGKYSNAVSLLPLNGSHNEKVKAEGRKVLAAFEAFCKTADYKEEHSEQLYLLKAAVESMEGKDRVHNGPRLRVVEHALLVADIMGMETEMPVSFYATNLMSGISAYRAKCFFCRE